MRGLARGPRVFDGIFQRFRPMHPLRINMDVPGSQARHEIREHLLQGRLRAMQPAGRMRKVGKLTDQTPTTPLNVSQLRQLWRQRHQASPCSRTRACKSIRPGLLASAAACASVASHSRAAAIACGDMAPWRCAGAPSSPSVAVAASVVTRPGFTLNARRPWAPCSRLMQPAKGGDGQQPPHLRPQRLGEPCQAQVRAPGHARGFMKTHASCAQGAASALSSL